MGPCSLGNRSNDCIMVYKKNMETKGTIAIILQRARPAQAFQRRAGFVHGKGLLASHPYQNKKNGVKQVFSISRKRGKNKQTKIKHEEKMCRCSDLKEGGWVNEEELELLSYEQRFDLVGSTET